MDVHELFTALSQQDRTAKVTIKDGKIHVGGKALKVKAEKADDEAGSDDKDEGGAS
jgi:hypothetical protein